MVLVLLIGIFLFFVVKGFMNKPVTHPCPYCRSMNTRQMGAIGRIDKGGFVGTAGKTHTCDDCGRIF